ncbi:MAG: nitrite reductase small subunit NirD [Candidatus Omnitrophica bacterium]|nr:nitrite reductase small subunit NirD [Candidatus Omnitrophota bacterium]
MMSTWTKVANVDDVLENGGSCIKVGNEHIAIFNFDNKTVWYAIANTCPHKKQSVLSRGLIGEDGGEPKVACPLHKNAFSLKTGKHLGGNEEWTVKTYPIKVENNEIYLNV